MLIEQLYNSNILFSLNECTIVFLLCLVIFYITGEFFGKVATISAKKLVLTPNLKLLLIIGLTLQIILCIILCFIINVESHILLNNSMLIDLYSLYGRILTMVATIVILISSRNYLLYHPNSLLEFCLLLVFCLFFLLSLLNSFTLFIVFVNLLASSIVIYALMGLDKINQSTKEATLKYFIISAVSTGLLGFSVVINSIVFLSTNFFKTTLLLNIWFKHSISVFLPILVYALILKVLTFLVKLGMFPSHLWTAEVYQGAPNPVTGFLMTAFKIALFFITVRILHWVWADLWPTWTFFIKIAIVVSLVWGAYGATTEQEIKKFLTFSSINQMAFVFMGLASPSFSLMKMSIFFLSIYVITNIMIFAIFLNSLTTKKRNRLIFISDFNSIIKNNPILSLVLIMSLFSFSGIPPLAGFFSKYYLLIELILCNCLVIYIFGLITSLITTVYYLSLINKAVFKKCTSKLIMLTNYSTIKPILLLISVFILLGGYLL